MRTEALATLKLIESGVRSGLAKASLGELRKRRLIYRGVGNAGIFITAAGRSCLWHEALLDTISENAPSVRIAGQRAELKS